MPEMDGISFVKQARKIVPDASYIMLYQVSSKDKIASAYDIPAKRVFTREELADAIDEMIATDGPFLLEACVIEEGNVLPMTPPGGSVNQMLLEC